MRAFKSVLLPLKAVILNLVSLGAAYGIIVFIFQEGHGAEEIWNVPATDSIISWIPLMIFAFLYGLSMDYEVFMLSRMREAYDETGDTNQAIALGLARTGKLVTSAALVLMFAFFVLSTSPGTDIKQFGIGLAAGIIFDATVIRALLVPSIMRLMGEWNWWLPAWAARMLRISPSPYLTPRAGRRVTETPTAGLERSPARPRGRKRGRFGLLQNASLAASFPNPIRLERSGGSLPTFAVVEDLEPGEHTGRKCRIVAGPDDSSDLGPVAVVDVHAGDVDAEVERLALDDLVVGEVAGDVPVRVLSRGEREGLVSHLHPEWVGQRDRPVNATGRGLPRPVIGRGDCERDCKQAGNAGEHQDTAHVHGGSSLWGSCTLRRAARAVSNVLYGVWNAPRLSLCASAR